MRYTIILLAALALIAVSSGAPAAAQHRFDVPILDSPFIGPADAPVTIIEFIDYQ